MKDDIYFATNNFYLQLQWYFHTINNNQKFNQMSNFFVISHLPLSSNLKNGLSLRDTVLVNFDNT